MLSNNPLTWTILFLFLKAYKLRILRWDEWWLWLELSQKDIECAPTHKCGESVDISEPMIEGNMDLHAEGFG